MNSKLSVKDLKVHFPLKKGLFSKSREFVYAVDGVDFHVNPGETLGIVGESGCGKTTTGLGVMGLIPKTSGQVIYKGEDISNVKGRHRKRLARQIQMIFQDPYSSLNPRFNVKDILSDPMQIHGLYPGKERMDRIAYLLEKVGLPPEYASRYPHEFSGGQRQRIGIARALALNPEIIVGDEPVSALDVSVQAQIVNLLIDLQNEFGLSYVIIAHDLAVVEHICDRVLVMYLGMVVESGSYDDIYLSPKHPYTRALLSAVPVPDPGYCKRRMILSGDVPSPIHPPSGCRFHPRCPDRMDICESQIPKLKRAGEKGQVRCFLYE